jgi:hypothetical protein
MTFFQPWNPKRFYGYKEEVDHQGQRYRCINPRWLGEPYLEPKIVEDPPQMIQSGWTNGQPTFRNLAGGQWQHLGASDLPVIEEKAPNSHPIQVQKHIQTLLHSHISLVEHLICDYLWAKSQWRVGIDVSYLEDDKTQDEHDFVGHFTFVSARIKKNVKSLGSLYFSMLPSPNLSFGYFGSSNIGAVQFTIHVFNMKANLWYAGVTEPRTIQGKEETKVPILGLPDRNHRSFLCVQGDMIGDGKLRVTQFCLCV